MNNNERRTRISQLKSQINPLLSARVYDTLRYRFLVNQNQPLTDEQNKEMAALAHKLDTIEAKLTPLFNELNKLRVRYVVTYEGEVFSGGLSQMQKHTKEFYLSTECDIDTTKSPINLGDPDINSLIAELANEIANDYLRYAIIDMKKLD